MIPRSNSLLSKLLSCARARVVWLSPSHSVCFPFTEPGLCMNTGQNGQLADREEIFAEFDKKCIGLELQTRPLIFIFKFKSDSAFNQGLKLFCHKCITAFCELLSFFFVSVGN